MPSAWPFELPRSGKDAISLSRDTLDSSVFREYDIRGRVAHVAPSPAGLNEFVVNRVGRAFGTLLGRRGVSRVVVGYDARSYSEPLAQAVIIGLMSTGLEVTNIGLATTPLLYFAQHELGKIAGVSVTASHNPNGWGGLKLSYAPSTTLGPEEIAELRHETQQRSFAVGTGSYVERSVTEAYVEFLAKKLPAATPLKVVVDGGNSVSGPIATMALRRAGYQVVSINEELDWSFPNHEPDPETMSARMQIQRAVLEQQADCGISLDGDGDRLGVTDDTGDIVWSDSVLAILARDVLTRRPGAQIVFDVKCSRAVGDVITASGGVPVMASTGHSLIKAKMRELGAPFAGERSGHFFDAENYYGYDDAIYAALYLLKVVSASGRSVSQVVHSLPRYHGTPTMQAVCPDDQKYAAVEAFAEYASQLGATELVRINGVRAEFPDGWILVRASSNLPALVLVAEATTEQRLRSLYTLLRNGLDGIDSVAKEWLNDPYPEAPGTASEALG